MSEREFLKVFARRLRHYLEINDMTQKELAERLGVGPTSVYNWLNEIKSPRMDKVDQMCQIFGCRRSDLISDDVPNSGQQESYYIDEDARELAEFLHKNPNYKVLFDASRTVAPEDIEFVRQMIERMGGKD